MAVLFSLSHTQSRTVIDDEEVAVAAQVDVADAGQQEAGDGVLKREGKRESVNAFFRFCLRLSVGAALAPCHPPHTSSPMTARRLPSGGGPEEGSMCVYAGA